MELHTIGIDLGKTVFHLVGLNLRGEVVVRKKFSRIQLLRFTANMHVELIGMEACGGAHFLGRALREQGHEVRLIPAQYVKPYVKTNKSDYIDAEAIAEAVARPTMRFVPIKTDDQLDMQSLHRVRERWVMRRTAVIAAIGNGGAFHKGREFAAWMGVVPREHSTGGQQKLLGISKRGNSYLRRLFVQGARAVLQQRTKKSFETELLMGKRARRIPSWPGVIHSNKGRIHLRRPTCDILTFRLRRSGGPYIPVCRPSGSYPGAARIEMPNTATSMVCIAGPGTRFHDLRARVSQSSSSLFLVATNPCVCNFSKVSLDT